VNLVFEVNDAAVREALFRRHMFDALKALRADTQALWGAMTAQQVVEHLAWTFEMSTGRARVECRLPEEQRVKLRAFLYDNRPSPHGFANPELVDGLPPLRHPDLESARLGLRAEVDHFLDDTGLIPPGAVFVHPLFGGLGREEWARSHFKHTHHHLMQFGLIGGE
jgi:oxepin-CoA hydrolase / 3-oxo-5,6-dehydrosuberyl-CoA semialdehyde dehydrogenase